MKKNYVKPAPRALTSSKPGNGSLRNRQRKKNYDLKDDLDVALYRGGNDECKTYALPSNNIIHLCVNAWNPNPSLIYRNKSLLIEHVIERKGGKNNRGISLWKPSLNQDHSTLLSPLILGKISQNIINKNNQHFVHDTHLNEAVHACILHQHSFSMKFVGVHFLSDCATAFYSYVGDTRMLESNIHTNMQASHLTKLKTFIEEYSRVGSKKGMSHNDLHASNVIIAPDGIKVIDYGRMLMFTPFQSFDDDVRFRTQAEFLNQRFDVQYWLGESLINTGYHDILPNYNSIFNSFYNKWCPLKPCFVYDEVIGSNIYLNYLFDMATFTLNILYEICNLYPLHQRKGKSKNRQVINSLPFYTTEDDKIMRKKSFNFMEHDQAYKNIPEYPILVLLNPFLWFIYDFLQWIQPSGGLYGHTEHRVSESLLFPGCFVFQHQPPSYQQNVTTCKFLNEVIKDGSWTKYYLSYEELQNVINAQRYTMFQHKGGRKSMHQKSSKETMRFNRFGVLGIGLKTSKKEQMSALHESMFRLDDLNMRRNFQAILTDYDQIDASEHFLANFLGVLDDNERESIQLLLSKYSKTQTIHEKMETTHM